MNPTPEKDSYWTRFLLGFLDHLDRSLFTAWIYVVFLPLFGGVILLFTFMERPDLRPQGILSFTLTVAAAWGMAKALRWRSRLRAAERARPVVHRVEVTRYLPNFSAECDCGWFGPDRTSLDTALADAREHDGVTPTRVTILDDPNVDEVYDLPTAQADVDHKPLVYRDGEAYMPSCSCGWEGPESEDQDASLELARVHAKCTDVEIVDIADRR